MEKDRKQIMGKVVTNFHKSGDFNFDKQMLSKALLSELGPECDICKDNAVTAGMYRKPGFYSSPQSVDFDILKLCEKCNESETKRRTGFNHLFSK